MNKIVIDTNVIISAFISRRSKPAKIVEFALSDENTLICYNDIIFAEYKDVFLRDKFKKYNFDIKELNLLLENIEEWGKYVIPIKSNIHMADEKDRIFYDTAKQSNSILVTGNIKHFPKEEFILSPDDFLQKMNIKND